MPRGHKSAAESSKSTAIQSIAESTLLPYHSETLWLKKKKMCSKYTSIPLVLKYSLSQVFPERDLLYFLATTGKDVFTKEGGRAEWGGVTPHTLVKVVVGKCKSHIH